MRGGSFLQVSSSTEVSLGQSDTSRSPVKTLDKDAFLLLLVEQLKNQDPMSPQDSNDFMAQMAQFSILEQLTNLHEEMAKLRSFQEMSSASALIGRQVKIRSGEEEISGRVEKVTLASDGVQVVVNGSGYSLDSVTEVD